MTHASPATASADSVTRYRARRRHQRRLIAGLAVLTLGMCLADIATGPGQYPLQDILATLVAPGDVSPTLRVIVWEIRLPVALMAALVGVSLASAGAEMQTILNNPLAEVIAPITDQAAEKRQLACQGGLGQSFQQGALSIQRGVGQALDAADRTPVTIDFEPGDGITADDVVTSAGGRRKTAVQQYGSGALAQSLEACQRIGMIGQRSLFECCRHALASCRERFILTAWGA